MTEGEFPRHLACRSRICDRPRHSGGTLENSCRIPPLNAPARSSPIHQSLGASFTDFAGWQMPVRYSSDLAEHHAVRTAAGIFDLSHMAEILVSGRRAGGLPRLRPRRQAVRHRPDAGEVQPAADRDRRHHRRPRRLPARRRRPSSSSPTPATGIPSSRRSPSAPTSFDVTVDDQSDDFALIAVQGPNSPRDPRADRRGSAELGAAPRRAQVLLRAPTPSSTGVPLLVARTGYTGEDGFELYLRADAAGRALARAAAGGRRITASSRPASPAGTPCGSRPACRSTATNSARHAARPGRPRPRRRTSPRRATSSAAPPSRPARPPTPGCSSAWSSDGRRAGRAGYPVVSGDTDGRHRHQRRPVADPRASDHDGLRRPGARRARHRTRRRRPRHARSPQPSPHSRSTKREVSHG